MRTRIALALLTAVVAALVAGPALARRSSALHASAAAKTHVVNFGEYFYRPKTITISVGDAIRFTNIGKIEHTVADSTKSGTIRSKLLKPRPLKHGQSETVRFHHPGTIYYLCTFHPTLMHGKIIVR